MSKQIKIFEGLSFWLGDTEAEEKQGFNEISAPFIEIHGKKRSLRMPIQKDEYNWFTEELFWLLAQEGKLRCPRCDSEMDYEGCLGDESVGMLPYEMAICLNEKCYFFEIDTEKKEQELIRETFPVYWRWQIEKKSELV